MDPFDVTSEARESKCEEPEEPPEIVRDEVIIPYHVRNPQWHDDARFIVAHHGGAMAQAWTIREAIRLARCTKAAYAVVFERHKFVVKLWKCSC